MNPSTLSVSRCCWCHQRPPPFGISIMVPLVPMLSISLDRSVSDLQYLFISDWPRRESAAVRWSPTASGGAQCRWGFAVFVGASILLIFVDTLGAMIFLRFMQAVGVGVGTVWRGALSAITCPPTKH